MSPEQGEQLSSFLVFSLIFIIFLLIRANKKQPSCGNTPAVQCNKIIKENKCTCLACGNVWYYGKIEELEAASASMHNVGAALQTCGNSMMCCGGCLPAAFLPKEQQIEVKNLNKCPKCNSSAVKKEVVEHEIK